MTATLTPSWTQLASIPVNTLYVLECELPPRWYSTTELHQIMVAWLAPTPVEPKGFRTTMRVLYERGHVDRREKPLPANGHTYEWRSLQP